MAAKSPYASYRFPAEVISHAVSLYFRFPLSLRMVEEMLAARGIVVSHETVRQWALKFGQKFANQIRRRLPCSGDKWHLDEVAIKIVGVKHWLWRALPGCRPLPGTKRLDQAGLMTPELVTYPGHRFPAEIISHAVWLYHVFGLSFRDVELLLAEWGITVTHESITQWCLKFGADFARKLRRRRPKPGDTWHLDEVFLKINGELHYLWRAVDQHGVVDCATCFLEILSGRGQAFRWSKLT